MRNRTYNTTNTFMLSKYTLPHSLFLHDIRPFSSIKRYFLMEQGDLFIHFMEIAQGEPNLFTDDWLHVAMSHLHCYYRLNVPTLINQRSSSSHWLTFLLAVSTHCSSWLCAPALPTLIRTRMISGSPTTIPTNSYYYHDFLDGHALEFLVVSPRRSLCVALFVVSHHVPPFPIGAVSCSAILSLRCSEL